MRVVMLASEVYPYAKTGGLADVLAALPRALAGAGVEVTVCAPGYRTALRGRSARRAARPRVAERARARLPARHRRAVPGARAHAHRPHPPQPRLPGPLPGRPMAPPEPRRPLLRAGVPRVPRRDQLPEGRPRPRPRSHHGEPAIRGRDPRVRARRGPPPR